MKPIYGLVSVTNKYGLEKMNCLTDLGIKLISTGNTAKALREPGLEVIDISDFTGLPEMMDGRLKTLHHRVFGGILPKRDNPQHLADAEKHDMPHIAFVIVNLYDFAGNPSIENIDIGGPTLLRAAAKNFRHTTVIVDPTDYDTLKLLVGSSSSFEEYQETQLEFRRECAVKVFEHTAEYDTKIAKWMQEQDAAAGARW